MGYKYADGEGTYTCGRCLVIMATAMDAVALRVEERESGIPFICGECVEKEESSDEQED